MKAIINGRIISETGVLSGKAVLFDESIADIVPENELKEIEIDERIDAKGHYVSPGFIDIHAHGAAGCDIMDEDDGGITLISGKKAASGVTSFLPTTMTMDLHSIEKALCRIRKAMGESGGVHVLGCHLEGSFISKKFPGAQDDRYILYPDDALVKRYGDVIKMITMAPEHGNAHGFIKSCVDDGIVISIGHSSATYDEAAEAIKLGARAVTHIFNAMPPLHHRNPGIIGAAMDSDDVYCELIADNIHVHPAVQRILLKSKGIGRLILVTDSMRATGMDDGRYEIGGQAVDVKDGVARLENGALAGSTLTIDRALSNFRRNTGISIEDAVKPVTVNPARLLGIDGRKGVLRQGADADIVVIDDGFNVQYTFVKGRLCYRRQ